MHAKPAALETALAPFVKAGLQVSVVGSHLLLHKVPVVVANRRILLITMISTFIHTENSVTPPDTHQVWINGPMPCMSDGQEIPTLNCTAQITEVAPGVPGTRHLSSKASDYCGYANHFELMMFYWRLFTDQARVIDRHATLPLGPGGVSVAPANSPFAYPDAMSARGNFSTQTARLAQSRVAIVGLGGTGSYLLDQLAKTPVHEIHLFDGDTFDMHNAYRAPGAAKESDFGKMKVDYFQEVFSHMHRGIKPHPVYVTDENAAILETFAFVFVCVDKGVARKLICGLLAQAKVPFIDCGMDLTISKAGEIFGTVRITMASDAKMDHIWTRLPTMDASGDALYESNIQIADMNSMNALLAIQRWKQYLGFYAQSNPWHHLEYVVDQVSMAKADVVEISNVEAKVEDAQEKQEEFLES